MSKKTILSLIAADPERAARHARDPYAERESMTFPRHIVELGDRLVANYLVSFYPTRDEDELSDHVSRYTKQHGPKRRLDERGTIRAYRFIRRSRLNLSQIGEKFGLGRLEATESKMPPEPEVGALSNDDQTALVWYLLDAANRDHRTLTGITGLRSATITQMLGVAPTPLHVTQRPAMTDAEEKAWWQRNRVSPLKELVAMTGETRGVIERAIQRHVGRNMVGPDGQLTTLARNYLLAKLCQKPGRRAIDALAAFGLQGPEWAAIAREIDSVMDDDAPRCMQMWREGQTELSEVQMLDVQRLALDGHHLEYIRHHLADRSFHAEVTPLIASVMRAAENATDAIGSP